MSDLKIQLTEEEYRIVIDGTPTEPAPYGESIECEVDGHRYMALADVGDGDGDTVESQLDSWVYMDGVGVEAVEMIRGGVTCVLDDAFFGRPPRAVTPAHSVQAGVEPP